MSSQVKPITNGDSVSNTDDNTGSQTAPNNTCFVNKKVKMPPDLPESKSCIIDQINKVFASNEVVPDSLIDKTSNMLKFNPAVIVEFDDASILAVLFNSFEKISDLCSSKYLRLICDIMSFTVSSKSLRYLLKYLTGPNRKWRPHSYELINQLKISSSFPHSMSFFNFPGVEQSVIAIPPISKWPYHNGWSFQCWFYLNPHACDEYNIQPRYLFCFQTAKGLGYTVHFLGNFLIVTSIKEKGKGLQHCVPTEFHPCRWYMLTLSYIFSRWSRCELRCYVNGNIISNVEMAWPVNTSDIFDKCILGGVSTGKDVNLFSGRMASIFTFTEALSPQQIFSLFALGPNYRGQFRFEIESKGILTSSEQKSVYDSKLSSNLMFAYTPSACDHHLCLDQSPRPHSANSPFSHSPHALMKGNVQPIETVSLQSALHCLGGIQLLYLLFDQIDYEPIEETSSPSSANREKRDPFPIAAQLFNLAFDLVRTSSTLRRQFARTHGLVVFAQALSKSPNTSTHLNNALLGGMLEAARYLTQEILSNSSKSAAEIKFNRASDTIFVTLLEQLFDQLLFAHNLWARASVEIQDRLYHYLADEFHIDLVSKSSKNIVFSAMHAIRTQFWIVPPVQVATTSSLPDRPTIQYLARIRSNLLLFIKPLILNGKGPVGEQLDCLLNFLSTVKEPDNLRDVLYYTMVLMSQHPATMVPAFNNRDGIQCVFQLLTIDEEDTRLYALKLLGYFFKYSNPKRKQESTGQYSVFSLLCDRISAVSPFFTMRTYNTFFELLTEEVTLKLSDETLPNPDEKCKIENPALLKTIAMLIIHSKRTPELLHVRQVFLEHTLSLCLNKEINRRAILQMSVWQDWVIGLASLFPTNRQNSFATATVMEILRCLLYYALRHEYGGWRVWIDTLAILHSRISFEEYRRSTQQQQQQPTETRIQTSPGATIKHESILEEPKKIDATEKKDATVTNMDLTDVIVRKLVGELIDNLIVETDKEKIEVSLTESDTITLDKEKEKNVTSKEGGRNGDEAMINEDNETNELVVGATPVKSRSLKEKLEALPTNPHQPRRSPIRFSSHAESRSIPPAPPPFRLPAFSWSYLHQILLDSILRSVEDDLHEAAKTFIQLNQQLESQQASGGYHDGKIFSETDGDEDRGVDASDAPSAGLHAFINDPSNQVYTVNLIHFISQISDSLVTACGGLLPLLAATTSPTVDLELQEPTEGLSLYTAIGFLMRVTNLTDVVIFDTPINLGQLESETGMNTGGILRQCLRMVCTCAVRNCLEVRLHSLIPPDDLLIQLRHQRLVHRSNHSKTAPLVKNISFQSVAGTADLADSPYAHSSASSTTSSVSFDRSADGLTNFKFFAPLRHKLNLIQRLAAITTTADSPQSQELNSVHQALQSQGPDVECYLTMVEQLSPSIQTLIFGIRPVLVHYPEDYFGGIFDKTVLHPVISLEQLLQNVDINRLHSLTYRDEEETKQVQFIALAVVYFLSVLMVSKYRDLLDPSDDLAIALVEEEHQPLRDTSQASRRIAPGNKEASQAPTFNNEEDVEENECRSISSVAKSRSTSNDAFSELDPSDPSEMIDTAFDKDGKERNGEPNFEDANLSNMICEMDEHSKSNVEASGSNDIVYASALENDEEDDSESRSVSTTERSASTFPEAVYEADLSEQSEKESVIEDEEKVIDDEGTKSTRLESEEEVDGDIENGIRTIHETIPTSNIPVSMMTGKSVISSMIGPGVIPVESLPQLPHLSPQQVLSRPLPVTTRANEQSSGSKTPTFQSTDNLTERLEDALGSVTPLLKEIFFEFAPFLSKTLLGSHGQELFSGGLTALRQSALAVELVMLLCSQEWQNSLQKHAGLAFIELVNEGRLLAKATQDHFRSVAQEADFILCRLRTLDLKRHVDFKHTASHRQAQREQKNSHIERILEARRQRDGALASNHLALTTHLLQCILDSRPVIERFADGQEVNALSNVERHVLQFLEKANRTCGPVYYRLDCWEDDSRRRRRFVLNPFGSLHSEAVLKASSSSLASASSTPSHPPTTATVIIDADALNIPNQDNYTADDASLTGSEEPSSTSFATSFAEISSELKKETSTNSASIIVPEPGLVSNLVSMHHDSLAFGQLETDASNPVVVSTPCLLIAAGVTVHGSISVTKTNFFFETDPLHEENKKIDSEVLAYTTNLYSRWSFSDIRAVFTRRYLLQNIALEIFLTSRSSVLFAMPNQAMVEKIVYALPPVGIGVRYGVPQSHKITLSSSRHQFQLAHVTARWQRREMSNFDYLMFLNTISGRNFNDLNQYPIFPWVISNYTSQELDLKDPANYRDLSKPIGALDPMRKAFFDERYKEWDDETQPPFHYGTHYSTAAFVLNYMIRVEPFTTLFLNMQGGRFDHPNRMFHSIESTWAGLMKSSTNVKELIPEFFYLPEMFENNNQYDLGVLEDGSRLGDVVLPPWASSPEEFVRINRQALESELVSCQMHHWIDLIFGYKQHGPEAVKATNVFCHLTYEGSVNWAKVTDSVLRKAIEGQIQSFGQTPSQLLSTPHPPRGSPLSICPRIFSPFTQEVCTRLKLPSISPLVAVYANIHPSLSQPAVLTINANYVFAVNKWNNTAANIVRRNSILVQPSPSRTDKTPPVTPSSPPTQPNTSNNTAQQTPTSTVPQSPLTVDLLMVPKPCANRRYLGDNVDTSVNADSNQFIATADNRAILTCGYFDNSFRVFSVDNGRCIQAVYGHEAVVTCLARSESNSSPHCYVASGGRDGLVLLWIFNSQTLSVFSESVGEPPLPQTTLVGHLDPLECIAVSAELGLVFSGSRAGICLIHTTKGELLRRLPSPLSDSSIPLSPAAALISLRPARVVFNREGFLVFQFAASHLAVYTINGKLIRSVDMKRQVRTAATTLPPSTLRPTSPIDSDYHIAAVTVSSGAGYLLVGGNDGLVWLLRLHTLEPIHCLPRCRSPITSFSLSFDQRFLMVGCANGVLEVFNMNFNRWHMEFQEEHTTA